MDTYRLISIIAKKIGRILKEIVVVIGHLLKGIIVIAVRKAKTGGKPKAIQAAKILKDKTRVFVSRAKGVGKPKAIEAGQLLGTQYTTFLSKTKDKVLEQIGKAIKEDTIIAHETHMKQGSDTASAIATNVLSEIILEKSKRTNLNERLAEEIIESGIECKAVTDIGSLKIERSSYYSYIFPMSPKIVTNRGCVILEDNNRNINLIQIIQKN